MAMAASPLRASGFPKASLNIHIGSLSQPEASESNSTSLGFSSVAYNDPSSEDEEPSFQIYDHDEAGSEESFSERLDDRELFLPATDPETAGGATPPNGVQDGILTRDIQRRSAYYGYAAEKQMSQADSKLFYQQSQLEAQMTGESNWSSQNSLQCSPVITATKSSSNMENISNVEQSYMRRSGSTRSMQSGQSSSQ